MMPNQFERTDVLEQSFPLRPGGRLEVNQDVGRVEVTAWERDEALMRATKRARGGGDEDARRNLQRLRLETHLHGDLLEVEASVPRGFFGTATGMRVDLEIKVPRRTRVKVDSASGDVVVEGVEGAVEVDVASGGVSLRGIGPRISVDTGSGNVSLEDGRGPVELDTGSGAVRVVRVAGRLQVDTGTGRVEVDGLDGELHVDTGMGAVTAVGVRGDVVVDTGGGDVRLARVDARRIDVDTGRGSIACDFVPRADGRYKFDTGTGGIELAVPLSASAELDLESDTGRAECALPLLNRDSGRGRLRGVIRRAASIIVCRSGLGDISVSAGEEPAVEGPDGPALELAPAESVPAPASSGSAPEARAARADDEDYVKVLKMVEEKRITPEAAEELLKALEEDESK